LPLRSTTRLHGNCGALAHPTLGEAVRQAAMGVEGWTMQM
jgi:hypothetical protein